jgi:hypothetical protein
VMMLNEHKSRGFRIKKVEEGLLCESEKIIMEFATMIAEMKYRSVFRSSLVC